MIAGVAVNIGGTNYTVPPFNIGLWERWEDAQAKVNAEPDKRISAMLRDLGPVLIANVQRNYPEAQESALMDALDLPAFNELREACHAMRRGGDATPTNAPAASPTGAA